MKENTGEKSNFCAYRAEVKGANPEQPYSKMNCQLMVSLGNKNYSGKQLDAIFHLIRRMGIKSLTIKIAGLINKTNVLFWDYYIRKNPEEGFENDFNLLIENTDEGREQEAQDRAILEGQQWENENKDAIAEKLGFMPNFEHIQPIYALGTDDKERLEEAFNVTNHCFEQSLFKKKILKPELKKAKTRLELKRTNPYVWFDDEDNEKADLLNLEYLKTECAYMYYDWFQNENIDLILYAGNMNKVQRYVFDNLIISEDSHTELLFKRIAVKETSQLKEKNTSGFFTQIHRIEPELETTKEHIDSRLASLAYGFSKALFEDTSVIGNSFFWLLMLSFLSVMINDSEQKNTVGLSKQS